MSSSSLLSNRRFNKLEVNKLEAVEVKANTLNVDEIGIKAYKFDFTNFKKVYELLTQKPLLATVYQLGIVNGPLYYSGPAIANVSELKNFVDPGQYQKFLGYSSDKIFIYWAGNGFLQDDFTEGAPIEWGFNPTGGIIYGHVRVHNLKTAEYTWWAMTDREIYYELYNADDVQKAINNGRIVPWLDLIWNSLSPEITSAYPKVAKFVTLTDAEEIQQLASEISRLEY